jgi:hypothetical protein
MSLAAQILGVEKKMFNPKSPDDYIHDFQETFPEY